MDCIPAGRPRAELQTSARCRTADATPNEATPTRRAQAVVQVLSVIATILRRRGRSPIYAGSEWAALRYIEETPIATMQGFAKNLAITKATAQPALELLTINGLIERRTNPQDRREKLLSLTRAGKSRLRDDPLRALAGRVSKRLSLEESECTRSAIDLLACEPSKWFIGDCPQCARARDLLKSGLRGDGHPSPKQDASLERKSYILLRVLYAFSPCIDKAGATKELTRREWDALRYFNLCVPSAATLGAYARYQNVTIGAASLTIVELREKGYLGKQKQPDNSRVAKIVVTRIGKYLARRDPSLKIAAVLEDNFDSEELGAVWRGMLCILECAIDV